MNNNCTRALLGAAVLAVSALFAALSQAADEAMLELATQSGCFVCHNVVSDTDLPIPLAPSYQAIAVRYQGGRQAFDELVERVLHGTVYKDQNWADYISMRFMPPNVNIQRPQAAALVDWILSMSAHPQADALVQHQANLALAATSGCLSCHAVEPDNTPRTVPLAPSFREIAAHYADQADSQEYLLKSVLEGTMGQDKKWPEVNMQFMPPSVALREQDAQQLVQWILGLKH